MGFGAAAGLTRAAACACVLACSSLAKAGPNLQIVGEASGGYTDNVTSSPNQPVPGLPAKAGGAFAVLSPGLVLALAAPRNQHRLAYAYTYVLFVDSAVPNTSAHRLSYAGFFDLSPSVALVLGSNLVQSKADTASTVGTDASLLPGAVSFLTATVDELLTFDLASRWRSWLATDVLLQTALAGGNNPQTTSVGGRTGIEHTWRTDSLGVEARENYAVITHGVLLDGSPAGTQQQLTTTALGQWRHDLGQHFTGRVEAGALRVDRLNTRTVLWSPAGTAALTYTNDQGDAELSYTHAVTTNPLLGQFLLVDEVRLHGGLPLMPNGRLLLAASAAYQQGRLLDQDANLAARLDTLLADVGPAWQATDLLLLDLRYQYVRRWSDVSLPPLPLSFTRNTLLLGATFRFPPESAMPRRYRAPQRVDRTDEIRDADTPVER